MPLRFSLVYAALLSVGAAAAFGQQPAQPEKSVPLIQPGAPGKPDKILTPATTAGTGPQGPAEADVRFMQGMIMHHNQAVEMVALMPGRTKNPKLLSLGQRISISQSDEMKFMKRWLTYCDKPLTEMGDMAGMSHMDMPLMPGMLTPKQMDALRKATGAKFDHLFNFSFWHSAMFNNAGDKVIFDDEWGGGSQPRCRVQDPMTCGADSIFTLKNHALTLGSYYKMPAPQTENENCTAHNGSIIPIPGRDIEVKSWYQGGVSVMDFTDATHPFEIAYFDRGPLDDNKFIDGGEWSAYWYNGYIYGSEIARRLDVFKLTPSKFVTQAEIDAAQQVHLAEFNAQAPTKIVYPANFVTAKAYVDQLARTNALTADKAAAIKTAMDKKNTKELKAFATTLDKGASTAVTPADANRMTLLAEILKK